MHSINNLMKWNDQQDKKVNYELMNLEELKRNRDNVKNLLKNESLVKKLSDKGSKLNAQLDKLEKLISEKENKKTLNEIQVDSILNKFESNLQLDENENEKKIDKEKSNQINDEKMSSENSASNSIPNYFAQAVKEKDRKASNKVLDENRLKEIKEKIISKIKNEDQGLKKTKMIPLDEAYKILKEHEKKIQEIQMKQAAEKLLQGKSVNYEYSFLTKTEENIKYREPKHNDYFDYEYYDDSDDEDDCSDEDFESARYNNEDTIDQFATNTDKLNRVHRNQAEKTKLKSYDKELNSVD